jgi:hypothetical protein
MVVQKKVIFISLALLMLVKNIFCVQQQIEIPKHSVNPYLQKPVKKDDWCKKVFLTDGRTFVSYPVQGGPILHAMQGLENSSTIFAPSTSAYNPNPWFQDFVVPRQRSKRPWRP